MIDKSAHFVLGFLCSIACPCLCAQGALQDPTRPPFWASTPTSLAKNPPSSTTTKPLAVSPLASPHGRLEILVLNPARPVAMVDGVVVQPGDRLGAWHVIAFSAQGIRLRQGSTTQDLLITPGISKTWRAQALPAKAPSEP